MRPLVLFLAVVALGALLLSGMLWQKLSTIQEALAKQSADTGVQAMEARASARQAQDLARDTAARLALTEAKLSEVALQRSQLDELMQSLSRSRDENLVVDIDSAIRLAQQQAQLAGSVQPLLAALKTAEQRVQRAAQPRLASLQRAIARDLDRVKLTAVSDTPALLVKMDELVRLADDLPVANAVATAASMSNPKPVPVGDSFITWWHRLLQVFGDEARKLVRVSRVEAPEAALLSPEQSFFLRENFKLRLLNARLGLLARQLDASRADLVAASAALQKYFDANSRKTQTASVLLQQVQTQMKTLELPRVDDTLSALATAAAGR
jgi:uroporphyrin-3 C-methyltransferase